MKGITFGVFDGLHQGHLNILEKAGKKCKLIVGVSSDEYVRDVKGVKTMFNYNHRAKLVSSLKFVWKVVKQEQGSKEKLVKKHKPDVIFVGTDWRGKDWDGAKLGIPVKYIKHTEGISSSQMRLSVDTEKMKTDTTFIIKTFKRYNCLENLLRSLKKHYPENRILIADDSDDFNAHFYFKWKKRLNLEVLRLPFDTGLSYGRNGLVERVKTPYILLLDDDFIFTEETKIEKFYKVIRSDDKIGVVGGLCVEGKKEYHYEFEMKYEKGILSEISDGNKYRMINGVKAKPTGSVLNFALFRTAVFKDILWDEKLKLSEHQDFYFRWRKTDWKIYYTPEVRVIHDKDRPVGYKEYRARSKQYQFEMFKKNKIIRLNKFSGVVYERKEDGLIKYKTFKKYED